MASDNLRGSELRESRPIYTREGKVMSMIPVSSSAIRAIGYDGRTLVVVFHNSGRYDHHGVPESVFHGLLRASSKGSYYNQHIRGRY